MATTELMAFTISSFFYRSALASVQASNIFLSFWFALFGETRSCYIVLYDLELFWLHLRKLTVHTDVSHPGFRINWDLESKECEVWVILGAPS